MIYADAGLGGSACAPSMSLPADRQRFSLDDADIEAWPARR